MAKIENIYDNYNAKCPNCGAKLSSKDNICPYCFFDLTSQNINFEIGEDQVKDALNNVNNAKKNLAKHEQYVRANSYKKSKERRSLIWLFVILGLIGIFILIGLISSGMEYLTDKKIEKIEDELHNKIVNTVSIDELAEDKKENLEESGKYISTGPIMRNKDIITFNLYSDSYNNDAIYTTKVFLKNFEFEDVRSYDSDTVILDADGFRVGVTAQNSYYYDRPVEMLTITEYTMDEVERFDNIKIGNYIFECYIIHDEFHLITNPYPDFYIDYEFYEYSYDEETLPIEAMNYLLEIEIEMK